ncbi:MAG: hypothetical protein HY962_16775 [Ignavibacteriae bacterium]|nr:hypothetical protein [Ignavibacteriota bacterium]
MKTTIQRPSIFLRLFLSHLLMLLFSFGVGLFVFDALFAPGLRPFLQRSPSILIPAVLALIGVAGLLAVWTATSITHPLERLVNSIGNEDAAAELEDIAASAPLEIAELAQALHASPRVSEPPVDMSAEQSDVPTSDGDETSSGYDSDSPAGADDSGSPLTPPPPSDNDRH